MTGNVAQTAKPGNYDPALAASGLKYVAGAAGAGMSIQGVTTAYVTGGVLTFAGLGLSNMADANYQVFGTNNTTAGAMKATLKTTLGFTLTGPANADSVDLIIVGCLDGQKR